MLLYARTKDLEVGSQVNLGAPNSSMMKYNQNNLYHKEIVLERGRTLKWLSVHPRIWSEEGVTKKNSLSLSLPKFFTTP